jgi:hypothetical protein
MNRCEKFRYMNNDKPPRPSISIDPELFALAKIRMGQRRIKMFSRYIQELIKEDTADLVSVSGSIPFPEPLAKVAEDSPTYGSERNDPAPTARRSEVSYTPKKTRGK